MTRECHNSTEIKNRDILIKISRPTQGKVKHDDACQARHNPSREHVKNFPRIKHRDSHKRRQPLYKFYKSARQESRHKKQSKEPNNATITQGKKFRKFNTVKLQKILKTRIPTRGKGHT